MIPHVRRRTLGRRVAALPVLALAAVACSSPGDGARPIEARSRSTAALTGATNLPSTERPSLKDALVPLDVVLAGPSAIEEAARHGHPGDPKLAPRVRAALARIDDEQLRLVPRIEAYGATVTARVRNVANVIQVVARPELQRDLARLPGVRRVTRTPIHGRHASSTLPFVGAPEAWSSPTPLVGDGVRIGIIDTGIDYDHGDFGGSGKPADYAANDPTLLEPGSFPTAKVVGGWDFVGDAYDAQTSPTTKPDPDPRDCAGHGTLVAGTAAGAGVANDGTTYAGTYDQSFAPSAFLVGPGVAPRAKLFALKVFGCTGATASLAPAFDLAADPNGDGDLSDRLDVVNFSLGTDYAPDDTTGSGTESGMVGNLVKVGSVVVVAAGNAGNEFYVVGSPATATEALAVAAVNAAPAIATLTIDAPSSIAGDVPLVEASFSQPLAVAGKITGSVVYASPAQGCTLLSNASAIAGNVALVDRGSCPFVDKFSNALAAGATAVVVVDSTVAPAPFGMGGTDPSPLPGGMIRKEDGDTIKGALASGVTVTLDGSKPFALAAAGGDVADFSSRGPRGLDNQLKPDVAGPGTGIEGPGVGTGTGTVNESGTSFSSPALAGAAALVVQANPTWSPFDVKAALMNSSVPVKGLDGTPAPVSLAGAGRVRVDRAVLRKVTAAAEAPAGAVSVSFGLLAVSKPTTVKQTIVVTNHGSTPVDYKAAAAPTFVLSGASATVSPASFTVPAGGTTNLELSLTVDPSALPVAAPDGYTPATSQDQAKAVARQFLVEAAGLVELEDQAAGGGESIVVPYHSVVRAAAERKAGAPAACPTTEGPAAITVPLTGESAHPKPLVTAFELAFTSPDDQLTDPVRASADLVAAGVATNYATAASFDKAAAYFGVAVSGTWASPGRSPLSIVTIDIDTNLDGAADYSLQVEPGRRQGSPFSDVFTARVNDLASGTQVQDAALYVNMLPADQLESNVFDNGVIVMPVLLAQIGLTADDPQFAWSVRTQAALAGSGEQTDFATFDPRQPAIDTTKYGFQGLPAFVGGDSVRVVADPKASPAPRLLLLHHMNVAGQRSEIVSLGSVGSLAAGDLVVSTAAPASVVLPDEAVIEIHVKNTGETAMPAVTLSGTLDGAKAVGAFSDHGACDVGAEITCDLGSLAAGADARVTLRASPKAGSKVAWKGSVSSTGCESTLEDNETAATIDTSPASAPGAVDAGGGCTCSAGPRGESKAGALLGLVAGLALARRRRRRG